MTSTSELVKRLQTVDEESCYSVPWTVKAFCEQAADRLEALEAENKLLREALSKLRSYNVDIAAGRINYRPEDHIAVVDKGMLAAHAALRKET
jgi:hypothetical protein